MNKAVPILIGCAVLIAILLGTMLFRGGASPWEKVAVVSAEPCDEEACKPLMALQLSENAAIGFDYYKDLEDGVTEWSNCVDALLACEVSPNLEACVNAAPCPEQCAKKLTLSQREDAKAAFLYSIQQTFLANEAKCGIPQ